MCAHNAVKVKLSAPTRTQPHTTLIITIIRKYLHCHWLDPYKYASGAYTVRYDQSY